jgi:hypothetical protein
MPVPQPGIGPRLFHPAYKVAYPSSWQHKKKDSLILSYDSTQTASEELKQATMWVYLFCFP